MARIRTFIAIDIEAAIRNAAATLQSRLAHSIPDVKWVEPDNFHLTLLFLGDVDDRDLHEVCRTVSKVVAGEPPFLLRVSGIGAFPNLRRPKVLWAGMTEGTPELLAIHDRLESVLVEGGHYRREQRPYTPHLTLGRIDTNIDTEMLAKTLVKHQAWTGGHMTVDSVNVYSSELRREGPEYTIVARTRLGGESERKS